MEKQYMSISVERFVTGPIETNTYVVGNESNECLIVDPSNGVAAVLQDIAAKALQPLAILITHGHFDHIGGIPEIIEAYPALKVHIHSRERVLLAKPELNMSFLAGMDFRYEGPVVEMDEGPFSIGGFSGTAMVIPGHSPAGTAFLIESVLLCGDILFAGSIGRSDFPGGNQTTLVEGIREKLFVLDDAVTVCPGHGGRTTIGRERRMNPFL